MANYLLDGFGEGRDAAMREGNLGREAYKTLGLNKCPMNKTFLSLNCDMEK